MSHHSASASADQPGASEQQRQGQQRQAALEATVEEFCRNISAALDNLSFETKRKILRLVVERVEFVEDQIAIKHVILISDVRLQRDKRVTETQDASLMRRLY